MARQMFGGKLDMKENAVCSSAWRYIAGIPVLGFGLLAGCSKHQEAGKPAANPIPVSTIKVEARDVPLTGEWVGTMDGNVNAQIQPQVTGYLIRQTYREGSVVQKGQVLFQIDPQPFQATLDQALGQLGQAEAQLQLAQINVNRDTPLAKDRAIAQSQLDTELQQQAQAEASVKTMKASVESARINLGYTQIRSLITGVAGQATTQVGNLVSPQTTVTSVSQMDPIRVYFSISDREYLALVQEAGASGGDFLKSASRIPLTLRLSNGTTYPRKGSIAFVDRQMNTQTGAIRVAALFPNPGNILRPGQFGRVSAVTQLRRNALLVPQTAIYELQGTQQAFTVVDGKVHVSIVKLGPQYGDAWIVDSGISPGTELITDKLQKLKEGAPVAPHATTFTPTIAPDVQSAGR